VVVCNDNARLLEVLQHVRGNEFPAGIVGIGIIGFQNPQPIFDGDARSDDQKALGKTLLERAADSVQCLPCDKHRHDCCLARTSGQLQRQP
jgi:hypothetical protein